MFWNPMEQFRTTTAIVFGTSEHNGYHDCTTSANVARKRILRLSHGMTKQYARWEPFKPCQQRHRNTLHQYRLQAQSRHQALCKLRVPLYQSVSTRLRCVKKTYPELNPNGLTIYAADCSSFENLLFGCIS